MNIEELIKAKCRTINDPAGKEVLVLMDDDAAVIAARTACTMRDVHRESLSLGVWPYRYLRNRASISGEEQIVLCRSCVAVVGAGGLGGHVILLLTRMGIGRLIVADPDRFDETNLNRQALAAQKTLGRWKADEAVKAVTEVNPGVCILGHRVRIGAFNAEEILRGADVVVDALDNIPDRLAVEAVSKSLGIPLVHGALAGFRGQVMTVFPGDPGLGCLYGARKPAGKDYQMGQSRGPETVLGVPAVTPAIVAGLQAAEVIKILLKRGRLFRNRMLQVDLETGEMSPFALEKTG